MKSYWFHWPSQPSTGALAHRDPWTGSPLPLWKGDITRIYFQSIPSLFILSVLPVVFWVISPEGQSSASFHSCRPPPGRVMLLFFPDLIKAGLWLSYNLQRDSYTHICPGKELVTQTVRVAKQRDTHFLSCSQSWWWMGDSKPTAEDIGQWSTEGSYMVSLFNPKFSFFLPQTPWIAFTLCKQEGNNKT